jgi:hypothetical protein
MNKGYRIGEGCGIDWGAGEACSLAGQPYRDIGLLMEWGKVETLEASFARLAD